MSHHDFLDPRLTERRSPSTGSIDVSSPVEIVELMNAQDKLVAEAVYTQRDVIARTIALAQVALRGGGRLVYVGAGTSGRLGVLDAAECPPTFGSAPEQVVGVIAGGPSALVRSQEGAEDDSEAAVSDVDRHEIGPKDLLIGIAASGTTPYVHAALNRAQELGACTILLTCSNPPEALTATCDEVIHVSVGPEVLTGSTRLKAGTATKMVLNTISTGAMIGLGKAYGNLMVDLMATSGKLVDRGERIVMEVCGIGRKKARQAIEEAGGSVKTAIVMGRRCVGRAEAENLLAVSGGIVRKVVGDPPPIVE